MKKTIKSVSLLFTVFVLIFSLTACFSKPANIREYYNNNTAAFTSIEKSCSNDDQTMKIYPEGDDTLVYEVTMNEQWQVDSTVKSAIRTQFNKQRATFSEQAQQIKEETGLDKLTIAVKYINADGTEIYSDSVS